MRWFNFKDEYLSDINMSMKFLDGKNSEIIEMLIKKMEDASSEQQYELAAVIEIKSNL